MTSYDPTTDPGIEILDHDGEGAVPDLVSRSAAFAGGTTAAAASASSWSDYEWATWLPAVLRAAGVPFMVEPGWSTNGRPRSVGPFVPAGVMVHHDASGKGPSPAMADFIGHVGRPAEGIPAPLSQLWLCVGCNGAHRVGTWHVLAAGRANHAGAGQWGDVARDAGNTRLIGVEIDHTVGESWSTALLDSLDYGLAAILAHLGASPERWLCGHKEWDPSRKIDPAGLDMDDLRERVALAQRDLADGHADPDLKLYPGRDKFQRGETSLHVAQLVRWLRVVELWRGAPEDTFTPAVRSAVREFQQRRPRLRGDADGIPGPLTWRLLQIAVKARKAEADR